MSVKNESSLFNPVFSISGVHNKFFLQNHLDVTSFYSKSGGHSQIIVQPGERN